jgi:hypothetical protein
LAISLKLSKVFKIYLTVLLISFVLFNYFYTYFPAWIKQTNINSALYLLSSLVQSEAAVLGIVVTLSIVAIQLTSSSYSTRIIGIFKESTSLWILLLTYIIAIIYGLGVLKFVIPIENWSNNEFFIWIAYLLGIYAFCALIPYILDVLNFIDPKTIINLLSSKITKKNILSTTAAEDYNVNYRPSGGPIQPLSDIMLSALMKYDYGTLKDGLKSIENSFLKILKNENLNGDEELDISNHLFLHHILRLGETAIDKDDKGSALLIIESLSKLGIMGADLKYSFFAGQAANVIGEIGVKSASVKNNENIINSSQVNLSLVGEKSAKMGLEDAVDTVLHFNFMICKTALIENVSDPKNQDDLTVFEDEINFNYMLLLSASGLIDDIGKTALEQKNELILRSLINNLNLIQKLNTKFNDTKGFERMEEIIEESIQKYVHAINAMNKNRIFVVN